MTELQLRASRPWEAHAALGRGKLPVVEGYGRPAVPPRRPPLIVEGNDTSRSGSRRGFGYCRAMASSGTERRLEIDSIRGSQNFVSEMAPDTTVSGSTAIRPKSGLSRVSVRLKSAGMRQRCTARAAMTSRGSAWCWAQAT
jgi:hypothetical protein